MKRNATPPFGSKMLRNLATGCLVALMAGAARADDGGLLKCYLRFTFTAGDSCFQISELALYDANTNRINVGMTQQAVGADPLDIPTNGWSLAKSFTYNGNEGPASLFDGNTSTKACAAGGFGFPNGFTFRFPYGVEPRFYNMATANDHCERSPTAWYVEASRDGETWTEIERRSGVGYPSSTYTWWNSGNPYAFATWYSYRKFLIDAIPDEQYRGEPVEPTLVVRDEETNALLTEDVDYTVVYSNNTTRGTGYGIVSGAADTAYSGIRTVATFNILAPSMSVEVANTVTEGRTPPYTTTVTVRDGTTGDLLVENTQYVLVYSNNAAPGVATVTVVGTNGYEFAAAVSRNYNIGARLRVAADGSADASGASWDTATTFSAALAKLAAAGGEIWMKTGTYTDISASSTTVISNSIAVLGGFAGTEATADARTGSDKADFDGGNARVLVNISNVAGAPVRFERCIFRRGAPRAFYKAGAGDLTVSGCVFAANRNETQRTHGRGLCAIGSGTARITVLDCDFVGNKTASVGYAGAEWRGSGFGIYADGCARLELADCTFASNGIPLAATGAGYCGKGSGSALCALSTPVVANRCRFVANVAGVSGGSDYYIGWDGSSGKDGACVFLDGNCGGSAFTNCVWVGNSEWKGNYNNTQKCGGAVMLYLKDTADTVDFQNCTIAYNLSEANTSPAGLNVVRGRATLHDSIVWGNIRGYPDTLIGADIDVKSTGHLTVSYSRLTSLGVTAITYASDDVLDLDADSVTTGDPLFVTPHSTVDAVVVTNSSKYLYFNTSDSTYGKLGAIDVHLQSTGGYVLNDGSAGPETGVTSSGVDGGDPESAYANEPYFNGERVNLGAYGNSALASRTAVGQPKVDSFAVSCPDGDARPHVLLTLGLASGSDYLATVDIVSSTGGVVVASNRYENVANGASIDCKLPYYFVLGTSVSATCTVKAPHATDVTVTDSGTVSGARPAFCGHGGGAGILHVRPGADCLQTGLNWTDAYPDLVTAVTHVTDETREIWVAKGASLRLSADFAPTAAFALRGGFDATEDAASERTAGAKTDIDNADLFVMATFTHGAAAPVTVDGFRFRRAKKQALVSTGAGDFCVSNCEFFANGVNVTQIDGRGILVDGSSAATVRLANCLFGGNRLLTQYEWAGHGCGIAVKSAKRAFFDDCTFVTNGIRLGSTGMANTGRFKASALYAYATPVTVRRCRFAGNVCGVSSYAAEGSCTLLEGACGGSAFTNCVWVGNSEWRSGDSSGSLGGALCVNLANAADTVDVQSCTIAYNLSQGKYAAAGLLVAKGAVTVRDSILYGNHRGHASPAVGGDLHVRADGSVSLAHVSLTGTNATCVTEATVGSITKDRAKILLSDPLFVTRPLTVNDLIVYASGNSSYFSTSAATYAQLAAFDVHLLSSAGYTVNGGAEGPAVTDESPAVDAGDPASDWSAEPSPNGGRINLGAYGNTSQASKSPERVGFTIGAIAYCVYDGTPCRPPVTATDRSTGAAIDVASLFDVTYTGNDAAGTGTATLTGKTGTAYAGQSAKKGFVIIPRLRVAFGLAEEGDGTDWNKAMSYSTAIAAAASSGAEIWLKAGTYTDVSASASLVASAPIEIRGGFAGTEASAAERTDGNATVIDGADARDLMMFANGAENPVTIEGLTLTRAKTRAVYKSGSGILTVSNCVFESNGTVSKQIDGRGIYANGGKFAAVRVEGCTFNGQRSRDYVEWAGSGNGIYAYNVATLTLVDDVFTCNGINLGVPGSAYCGKSSGTAICALGTPVIASGCRFAGNNGGLVGGGDYYIGADGVAGKDGACVFLDGACGGSKFSNCIWIGNGEWIGRMDGANHGGSPAYGGAVLVNLPSSSDTVDFSNCTIAYNVGSGTLSPAGLNVVKGTVTLAGSILYGNVRGHTNHLAGADIDVKSGGRVQLDYCIVPAFDDDHVRVASGGTLDYDAATVRAADPKFMSTTNDLWALTAENSSGYRAFSTASATFASMKALNGHLRGRAGYYDETTGERVRPARGTESPALDVLPRSVDCSSERLPNAGRRNLGAYGNTPWATMSYPTGTAVLVR